MELSREGETYVRTPLNLPFLIVIGSLVLAITGCGNGDDAGTGEAPGEARQAEQAPESAADDARVLWRAPEDPLERTVAAGLESERKEFLIHPGISVRSRRPSASLEKCSQDVANIFGRLLASPNSVAVSSCL